MMKVKQNLVLNASFIILFEKKTVRASKNLFIADVVNIKLFPKLKLVINHLFLFLRWISKGFGATTLRKDNNRFHQLPIGKDMQKFNETSKQDVPNLMPLGFY